MIPARFAGRGSVVPPGDSRALSIAPCRIGCGRALPADPPRAAGARSRPGSGRTRGAPLCEAEKWPWALPMRRSSATRIGSPTSLPAPTIEFLRDQRRPAQEQDPAAGGVLDATVGASEELRVERAEPAETDVPAVRHVGPRADEQEVLPVRQEVRPRIAGLLAPRSMWAAGLMSPPPAATTRSESVTLPSIRIWPFDPQLRSAPFGHRLEDDRRAARDRARASAPGRP